MVKAFNSKKKCVISLILITIVTMGCIIFTMLNSSNNTFDLTDISYRTDIEPLTKRFGEILNIEACFWKADTISKTNFGPSSYWMKGFAFISQENSDFLKSKYTFTDVDIIWQSGMTPDITGKSKFRWSYNKELSNKIFDEGFIGEVYFDFENNICYFDLENR